MRRRLQRKSDEFRDEELYAERLKRGRPWPHLVSGLSGISGLTGIFGGDPYAAFKVSIAGYWKLGETTGAVRADSSPNGNDLTNNNNVSQAAGKIGNASQFVAASNQSLTRADNASLSTGNIDFTLAFWVWFDTVADSGLMSKEEDSTHREFRLDVLAASGLRFITFNAAGSVVGVQSATTFGVPGTGVWIFVVAWHDSVGATVNIQVNNGTVDSAATTGVPSDTVSTFSLGTFQGGGGKHNGRMDAAGFWKRTLTVAERTALYNNGAGLEIY